MVSRVHCPLAPLHDISKTPISSQTKMKPLNWRTLPFEELQVITAESSNVLQAAQWRPIRIATGNAFMTVFIFVLCIFAITMIIFILRYDSIIIWITYYMDEERFCTPSFQSCLLLGIRSVVLDLLSPHPRRSRRLRGSSCCQFNSRYPLLGINISRRHWPSM